MNSPFTQYPSAHADVFNALTQSNAAANDMAASKRRSELGQQADEFARRYALQALQTQMDAQSQRNNLLQSRMDGALGPMSNLLRGLYE